MKFKNLLLAFTIMLSAISFAQEKGDLNAIGTFSISDKLGVGGGLEYMITDNFSVASTLNFNLTNRPAGTFGREFTELNVNARYYFYATEDVNLFGILGYHAATEKIDFGTNEVSNTEHGVNIGAGVLYPLSDKFGVTASVRYATTDLVDVVGTVGLQYTF